MKKYKNGTEYEIDVSLNGFSFDFKISEKKEIQTGNVKSLKELLETQEIFTEEELKRVNILPF